MEEDKGDVFVDKKFFKVTVSYLRDFGRRLSHTMVIHV